MPFCMPKLMKPGFLLRTFFGIMTQPLHRIASHFRRFFILSDVLFPAHLGFHVCEILSGRCCHCIPKHSTMAWKPNLQIPETTHTVWRRNLPSTEPNHAFKKNGHRFYFLLWESGHTFPAPGRGARKSQPGETAGERRLRTSESRGSCPLRVTPARASDEAASPSPPSGVSPSSDSQQH